MLKENAQIANNLTFLLPTQRHLIFIHAFMENFTIVSLVSLLTIQPPESVQYVQHDTEVLHIILA